MALAAGSSVLLVIACGRTADVGVHDGGADAAMDTAMGIPMASDAASAGMMCVAPPSECIDEHTMRYFGDGTLDDAGMCEFKTLTMKCEPSPVPPDCYQGGCRVVVVR